MKLFLVTIITALLMTVGTAAAQNINFGIKGGLNSYNINTDPDSDTDSKIGLNVGLLGHIHLTDQYAFQPELVYSMQGATSGNTDLKLNYINVPLLVQYMFDNGFRIQAGPQLGYLLNAESENNNSSNDLTDNFKSIDMGLSLGASYVHPPTGFGVDARYNFGLTNISDSSNLDTTNRGFQVGVFYLFSHRN